ncbi:MAG: tRNA (guanosine(37)-N1)-methyltransferase TrmD [Bacteriovoracaceae bacterium]
MKITVITLFPSLFEPFLERTMLSKVGRDARFEIEVIDLAKSNDGDFKGVDDAPYGGGQGMVIKADVLKKALIASKSETQNRKVIYTSPRGEVWKASVAREFANNHLLKEDLHLIFICGRYEGIDERFISQYVDEIYSIGDYVLMGGEIAVLAMLESSFRFVPNILGNSNSADEDSFEENLIEYPQYTRPQEFEGLEVPKVLLSGDHKAIKDFRLEKARELTEKHRPDLLKK